MSPILLLTEKSTQVEALSAVFPLKRVKQYHIGKYQGEDIIVFPLSGHVLDIIPLTERGCNVDSLPNIAPKESVMKRGLLLIEEKDSTITKRAKRQSAKIYNSFKKVIEGNHFKRIILATDPDYEGCAIGKEMIDEFNLWNIPINYMNISNISKKRLKKELDFALGGKDAIDWKKWALLAQIRADASHCIGIDVSAYIMGKTKTMTTFGTQQTRALEVVVKRYLEHENSDTSKYYRLRVKTVYGDFLLNVEDGMKKDRGYHEDIKSSLGAGAILNIDSIKMEKKVKHSPSWYDGSMVAAKVAKKYKIPIKKIFSKKGGLLQTMYEQRKTTYPRGSAEGKMPISQLEEQILIAKALNERYKFPRVDTSLVKSYLWRDEDKGGKIINHTPCTISDENILSNPLNDIEKIIIDTMGKMILSCFYPDNTYHSYTVQASPVGAKWTFEHESIEDVDLGWKEIYKEKLKRTRIKELSEGAIVEIESVMVEEYTKSPPALFNEATLLEELKRKNIGAESTFQSHIDTILDKKRGLAKIEKGKIIPTQKGIGFVNFIPVEAKEVLSILEEDLFAAILTGEIEEKKALSIRYGIIKKTFETIKNKVDSNLDSFTKMLKIDDNNHEDTTIGICPVCGGNAINKEKVVACENNISRKTDTGWANEGCFFLMFKGANTEKISYRIGDDGIKELLSSSTTKQEIYYKEARAKVPKILKLNIDEALKKSNIEFI